MKDAKFILIENDPSDLGANIARLVAAGVSSNRIWPKQNALGLSGIADAKNKLAQLKLDGWDPQHDRIILLMDLSLDANDADWASTIEALRRARIYYAEYILIICSKHDEHVLMEKGLESVVMGYMNKQLLADSSGGDAYFRKVIRTSIAKFDKRRGVSSSVNLSDHCSIEDTLGLRLFEEAYGAFALIALLEMVTEGRAASLPSATIATGGYSGSFVVLIELTLPNSGSRRFAAKLSRDEEDLMSEYRKLQAVGAATHKFAELPIHAVDEVKPLRGFKDDGIYVLLQHYSEGVTFERQALHGSTAGLAASITNALRDMTEKGLDDKQAVTVGRTLSISNDSIFRFESSFRFSQIFLAHLMDVRGFTSHFKKELSALPRLREAAAQWPAFLRYSLPEIVTGYEQHGDLNPRNILVEKLGKASYRLKLIDFARFGLWPAFYDLTRLRLQLAFRFADPPGLMADQLPTRIVDWDLAISKTSAKSQGHPKKAVELTTFTTFHAALTTLIDTQIGKLEANEARIAKALVPVLELYDLIKMVSYQDASWPKRTWFVLLAARRLVLIEEACGHFEAVRSGSQ